MKSYNQIFLKPVFQFMISKNTPFVFSYLILLTLASCQPKEKELSEASPERQAEIIEKYLRNGAWTKPLYSREYQEEIDKGIAEDPTVSYLWQQKAMPMFKQGKYEAGIKSLDKAVELDDAKWREYRAFMKCIFAKTYQAAIDDFEECKKRYGNNYVMDHSYDFYIGLSHLQLNHFEKAETILENDINFLMVEKDDDWVHHLNLLYAGIAKYEMRKYEEGIAFFDRALKKYPNFSDAKYYKATCLFNLGEKEEAQLLMEEAEADAKAGYTINEDNAMYERYPYQVRWLD
jgi:tetratricopeptide (TPR) repeat protein